MLCQIVAYHFETWHELANAGQFDGLGDHHTPKPYVRQVVRKYLECGIFAHGSTRARCDDCRHDYFVALSCKGWDVCPSCNTRRMVEMAAHLSDQVFPRLLVRQWVSGYPPFAGNCFHEMPSLEKDSVDDGNSDLTGPWLETFD